MNLRRATLVTSFAAISAVIAAGVTVPASAAPAPSLIATANGVVGLPQTIEVRAPRFANQSVALSINLNGTPITQVAATVNGQGSASAVFTPPAAGNWTVTGVGSFSSATPSTAVINPVSTTTVLFGANQAQAGVGTTLVATVTSNAGSLAPQGNVVFSNQFGGSIGTVPLVTSSGNTSSASIVWTPPSPNVYPIVATYQPAAGAGGSANATSSSATDSIEVLAGQPLVTLRLPTTFTIGKPTTITALVNNLALQGSVSFINNVNGNQTGISGSVALNTATMSASVPWTPTAQGNQLIVAQFTATNSFESAQATQIIGVTAAPNADPLNVGPAGQAAWTPGAPITLPANTSLNLASATGSGSPVSISETGPCLINGVTLITAQGAANCVITVTSPGSAVFAPQSISYQVTVTAPPKKPKRPARR